MGIFLKCGLSFMRKNLYMYIKYTDNELEVNHLSLLGLCSIILSRAVLKRCILPSDVLFVAVGMFSGNLLNISEGSSISTYY